MMNRMMWHIINGIVLVLMVIGIGLVGFYLAIVLSNHMVDKQMFDTSKYTLKCNRSIPVCEVYLNSTLSGQDYYNELYYLIENAPKGSKINLHLSGVGGNVDTVIRMFNAIRESQAEVNTLIEGPVLSAHAMISLMGKHIIISDASYFMFHKPAIFDSNINQNVDPKAICKYYEGQIDRGQDFHKKCLDNMQAEEDVENVVFGATMYKYLNLQEQLMIHQGFDVYVSAADMQQRVLNMEAAAHD